MNTTIALVIDRSGSMDPLRNDTIGGVNNFIKDQQAIPGDCDLTMVQFSTGAPLFIHRGTPIKSVAPLTKETYRPVGGTALLDAMGQCIDETGKRLAELPDKERPERVIFCVVTDGEENSSHDFTAAQIAEKVKHQTEKYGWQFVFLGANMDSIAAAATLGIQAQSAMNYQATPVGTAKAYAAFSRNVASSRTGGAVNMDWSAAQRKDNS
jgi:hypothetical protein